MNKYLLKMLMGVSLSLFAASSLASPYTLDIVNRTNSNITIIGHGAGLFSFQEVVFTLHKDEHTVAPIPVQFTASLYQQDHKELGFAKIKLLDNEVKADQNNWQAFQLQISEISQENHLIRLAVVNKK